MDFYPAANQIQQPDILGAYVRGRMAPLAIEQQQQQNQEGALKLDQLRQIINYSRQLSGPETTPQTNSDPAQTPTSYGSAVGDSRVNIGMALAALQGRDPLEVQQRAQDSALKQNQLKAQGPLSFFKAVADNPNADKMLLNNPNLLGQYPALAQRYGVDPRQITADNVRKVAQLQYNEIAAGVGLPGIQGQPEITPYQQQELDISRQRLKFDSTRIGMAQDKVNAFAGERGALLGALVEKGVPLPAGFRSQPLQIATLDGLLARNPTKTPDEIADLVKSGKLDLAAETKEVTTAAGVAGKVAVAANEIQTTAPLLLQASADLPRGTFMPINKLLQAGESSISDPRLRKLKVYVNSMLNAYDLLAGRGGTDVAKRETAHQLLMSADSPEALQAGVEAFANEAKAAGDAARMAEGRPVDGQNQNKRITPEEAAKLPSGTRFTGTDGVERVKH